MCSAGIIRLSATPIVLLRGDCPPCLHESSMLMTTMIMMMMTMMMTMIMPMLMMMIMSKKEHDDGDNGATPIILLRRVCPPCMNHQQCNGDDVIRCIVMTIMAVSGKDRI